jgi:hypothetical protein
MSLFRSVSLIKVTHAPGDWVLGDWVEGEKTSTPFLGSWQPASGKALEILPVGKRSREAYKVFAPIEIDFTPADETKQISGDIVIKEGIEYEVSAAAPWNNGMIPHWELICTRVPANGEGTEEPEDDETP